MFRQNYDGVLLQCFEKRDTDKILTDLHDDLARCHFSREATTHKYSKMDTIGQQFLEIPILTHENSKFVNLVVVEKRKQVYLHYLFQLKDLSNYGGLTLLEKLIHILINNINTLLLSLIILLSGLKQSP